MKRIDVPLAAIVQATIDGAFSGRTGASDAAARPPLLGIRPKGDAKSVLKPSEVGGPIMPFELAPDELTLARFAEQGVDRQFRKWIAVYSRWSRTHAGWLESDGSTRTWHDTYHPPPDDAEPWAQLYPAGRRRSAAGVASAPPRPYVVRVRIDRTLQLVVERAPGVPIPNGAYPRAFDASKKHYWEVSLHSGSRSAEVHGIRVVPGAPEDSRVTLEVASPEAILRVSGAAEAGQWISVSDDYEGTVFRIPQIADGASHDDAWVTAHARNDPFFTAPDELTGAVDSVEFARAVFERRWIAAPHSPEFVRALAELTATRPEKT